MALYKHAIQLGDRGMRILRFPLVRLVIAISIILLSTTVAYYLSEGILRIIGNEPFPHFKGGLQVFFICSLSILFYWFYVALFEGRELSELSVSSLVPQLGFGLLLGLIFISIIILVISLFGGYQIIGYNKPEVLIPVLLMALQAGIFEEILTRGALFRIVEDGLGTWWSVLISAMIFGFLHIWNPNATFFSSLSIAMTAGVILALFFVITRKLWIPIGIHIAWNFTLGGIYGAAVSGGAAKGLIRSEMNGSDLLTGGEFGPEASVITVVFFALLGIYLAWYAIKKGAIKKPSWKKS